MEKPQEIDIWDKKEIPIYELDDLFWYPPMKWETSSHAAQPHQYLGSSAISMVLQLIALE